MSLKKTLKITLFSMNMENCFILDGYVTFLDLVKGFPTAAEIQLKAYGEIIPSVSLIKGNVVICDDNKRPLQVSFFVRMSTESDVCLA